MSHPYETIAARAMCALVKRFGGQVDLTEGEMLTGIVLMEPAVDEAGTVVMRFRWFSDMESAQPELDAAQARERARLEEMVG